MLSAGALEPGRAVVRVRCTSCALLQPNWFSAYAVSVQEADPHSTLNLYRRALALRGRLFAGNDFGWVDSEPSVLHFACGDGVRCVTNFGADPASLPPGAPHLLMAGCPATPRSGCEWGNGEP